MEKWNEVKLVPEFSEQGVDCYRLAGGDYENEYYVPYFIVSTFITISNKRNITWFSNTTFFNISLYLGNR